MQPPLGEKQTFVMSAWKANAGIETKLRIRNDKTIVVILLMDLYLNMKRVLFVMMTTEAETYGNIQDFSEYVEEIRDIFKRMVILLKIPNLQVRG